MSRVLIIGPGLIGGSLARSLKATGFASRVSGYGRRAGSLRRAVELGVLDDYSLDLEEAVAGVDIAVLAAPPLAAAALLGDLLPLLDGGGVLTDVASVKGSLLEAARAAGAGRAPARLVLGHPIAGSERSGVEASRATLFAERLVILTPTEETDPCALAAVRGMWASTGADVVELGVAEHDAILAATSHLPHVLAYALVDALAASDRREDMFRFAAGGLRDFTRIASSDPVMWRDVALANRRELLAALDGFAERLRGLRGALERGDGERLHELFRRAKAARDELMPAGGRD